MTSLLNISFDGIKSLQQFNHHALSLKKPFLQKKYDFFQNLVQDPKIGIFNKELQHQAKKSSKDIYQKFKHIRYFIHVGMGGSALGPQMITSALQTSSVKMTFINNIDPDYTYKQLSQIEINQSLFYIVSKSGNTLETLANLSIIIDQLSQSKIPPEKWKKHIILASSSSPNSLRNWGKQFSINQIDIPETIGGRFSSLTPVGFIPALFAGLDIDKFIDGSKKVLNQLLINSTDEHPLFYTASLLYELLIQKKINQTVLMPYSSQLKTFSLWFAQLWAESLGKKNNLNGDECFQGLTPIPAYGTSDQHSLMQLFLEGPFDKCLFLIEVEQFNADFKVHHYIAESYINDCIPFSLSQLLKAELMGTQKSLKLANRPYIHITIPSLNEESLGGLITYFHALAAMLGHYLSIDPFNQPGVKQAKEYSFDFLKSLN